MERSLSTLFLEAVQDLRGCAADEELREGEAVCNALGLPLMWSGNFADVFKVHCPATGNTWALKCFTRHVPGLQERYRRIAAHLAQARLPFTVDFEFLDRGLCCDGRWFPALKMRWVEGRTLNQFVEEHLQRPRNLRLLLDLWTRLAQRLREAEMAHADLQHGNVLLVPQAGGALALRLIDYDGMFVPALAGNRSGELGHPAYQHPQRLREGTYNVEIDRFSHLVIYAGISCLLADGGALWQRFHNGDNLLFRPADFSDPARSELFRTLWAAPPGAAREWIGRVMLACQAPLEKVPLLEQVLVEGRAAALTAAEESALAALHGPRTPPARRARTPDDILGDLLARSAPRDPAPSAPAPRDPQPAAADRPPAALAEALFTGGAPPGVGDASPREITVDLGDRVMLELVRIAPGEFLMGSPDTDASASAREKPAHRVRITRPFYLGRYPLTQRQWQACMGSNPSHFPGASQPVEQVTWHAVQDFMDKLNAQCGVPGWTFALPSEAQWEYACRAGSEERFYFGDDEYDLGAYAWFDGNAGQAPQPVGQKPSNAWGLYDMLGNVWEWCADWYDPRYYVRSAYADPAGPSDRLYRVLRGGAWHSEAPDCRPAARSSDRPDARANSIGFRVALLAVQK